jgi:hypothetical protein
VELIKEERVRVLEIKKVKGCRKKVKSNKRKEVLLSSI